MDEDLRIAYTNAQSPQEDRLLRRGTRRDLEGVIHEQTLSGFAIVDVGRHIFTRLHTHFGAKRARFIRLVHNLASSKRRQGLSESLRQLPRRQSARNYGSSACRQTILARLRWQEGLDSVV